MAGGHFFILPVKALKNHLFYQSVNYYIKILILQKLKVENFLDISYLCNLKVSRS